jgi:hypothetical protein
MTDTITSILQELLQELRESSREAYCKLDNTLGYRLRCRALAVKDALAILNEELGWRPMDTAPSNTFILLAAKSGYTSAPLRVAVCQAEGEDVCGCRDWRDQGHVRFLDDGEELFGWLPLPPYQE